MGQQNKISVENYLPEVRKEMIKIYEYTNGIAHSPTKKKKRLN